MKILIVSEFTGLGSTGYSNYYKQIAESLHDAGHHVVELASYGDCNNPAHVRYQRRCKWKVILNVPNKNSPDMKTYDEREKRFGDAKFGAWAFDSICSQEQPDVVLAIRDHWYDKFIIDSPASPYFVTLLSPTVDSRPLKGDWVDTYGRAEVVTFYTQWSEEWFKVQCKSENAVGYITSPASSDYKILDKKTCRAKLGIPQNIKLITTVMRNQSRKRFPELFEAVAKAPGVYLHIHTAYPDKGWDIPNLILQNNIQHKTYITYMCSCGHYEVSLYNGRNPICNKCKTLRMETSSAKMGISNSALCEIYGASDLYVQPASNEGLGIPVLEAAKCGLRVVGTNYSALETVIPNVGGTLVNPLTLATDINDGTKKAIIHVEELTKLLNDPETYNYNRRDIAKIYEENYNWEKTNKKWVELVNTIKPKNKWVNPPAIKQALSFAELEKLGHDNEKYLITCILYVACRPDLLGSYLHTTLLDNLNSSCMMISGPETMVMPIDRKYVYNRLREIREVTNRWEGQRKALKKNQN